MSANKIEQNSVDEDERIRKELIDAIQSLWDNDALPLPLSVKRKDEWIAWIEKQGERKPVISDDALREGITRFGITQYQIDNCLKKYIIGVEKQGEKGG